MCLWIPLQLKEVLNKYYSEFCYWICVSKKFPMCSFRRGFNQCDYMLTTNNKTLVWALNICRVYFRSFFLCLQKLQQELEFLEVQEEYIKDEQKNLKKEFLHAQEEVKRIQSIPLVIGQFLEAVDQNTAIVGSTTGNGELSGVKFELKCFKDPPSLMIKPKNINVIED